MVMASFVIVLMLPIAFFVYSLLQKPWMQIEDKMLEKHHLISAALVEPFTIFFSSRQEALYTLGQELLSIDEEKTSSRLFTQKDTYLREQKVQEILDKHLKSFGNFVALYYFRSSESDLDSISSVNTDHKQLEQLDYLNLPLKALPAMEKNPSGEDFLSPAVKSSINDKPVILIKHSVIDSNQATKGTIYAEVSLDHIRDICSGIQFGVKGHCAVVDTLGHAVAHPNKGWVQEIRDLSKIRVAGVLLALLVSVALARKVTDPINLLISLTHKSDKDYESVNLGKPPSHIPNEIQQLWTSFSNLLTGLQHSNKEVKRLNISLQEDIQKATADLQEMNKNLYITSSQDYLTSLSNRRHFTQYLGEVLKNKVGENIGIIMIDVDKFKHLNDHFGGEIESQLSTWRGKKKNEPIETKLS